MKMMIIDDELNIRQGIRYSIAWKDIGIEQVKDYPSGEAALKDFPQYLPDIIISDIKMDGMTGLEFLRKAKDIRPDVKMVFMSGYADFEYVVQAMKLGAVDYQLKPINCEKLMGIIKDIMQDIVEEHQQQEMLEEIENKNRAKRTFELLNTHEDKENVSMYFENIYEIDSKKSLIVGLLEIDHFASCGEGSVSRYLNVLKDKIQSKIDLELWAYHEGLCLIMVEVNASFMYAFNCQYIIKRSIEYVNAYQEIAVTGSAVISSPIKVNQLLGLYQQMQVSLQDKFYSGAGSIYSLDEDGRDRRPIDEDKSEALKKSFYLALAAMDLDRVEGVLRAFQDYWGSTRAHTKKEIKRYISDLMKEFMLQQIRDESMAIIDIIQFNEAIRDLNYLEEMIVLWKNWIGDYYDRYSMIEEDKYSNNIKKALTYILKHYKKEISAECVASYIDKTPNYFSSLFKKEIGMNFSEYVNVLRVKKAKELMENSDMLLNEIAVYVGYSNYIYFSQVFKKIEGITPSKFRKTHRDF